jgi:hypothetical protein
MLCIAGFQLAGPWVVGPCHVFLNRLLGPRFHQRPDYRSRVMGQRASVHLRSLLLLATVRSMK